MYSCAVPSGHFFFWRFTEKSEAANDRVVMLGCTVKSLQFSYLFCWFKCHVNVPNDVECVNVLLTKIKANMQHSSPPETDSGCSYRETQALSPLGRGCLYPMATPYLKSFIERHLTIVGTEHFDQKGMMCAMPNFCIDKIFPISRAGFGSLSHTCTQWERWTGVGEDEKQSHKEIGGSTQ